MADIITYVIIIVWSLCIALQGYDSDSSIFMSCGLTVIVYIIFGMVAKIMKENKSQVDNATYDILTWGVRYSGVIVDYCDGEGKAKDGITPLDLIVRLNKGENWYEVQAASGGYMESDYPIGANCEIAIAGTQAVLVPGTVCTN